MEVEARGEWGAHLERINAERIGHEDVVDGREELVHALDVADAWVDLGVDEENSTQEVVVSLRTNQVTNVLHSRWSSPRLLLQALTGRRRRGRRTRR